MGVELRASHEVHEHKLSVASRASYFFNPIVVFVVFFVVVFCCVLMDKPASRGDGSGGERPLKHASMSTDEDRPLKVARTGSSSDTCRLKDILVSRRRVVEDEGVEVELLVRAQVIKENEILSLVTEDPDVKAYVNLGTKYLNARGYGTLPGHWRASKIVYARRSRAMVYGTWRRHQEEWKTVKDHTEDGMNMPMLRDETEVAYVSNLARFVHGVEARRYREDWSECCMLL